MLQIMNLMTHFSEIGLNYLLPGGMIFPFCFYQINNLNILVWFKWTHEIIVELS